MIDGKIMKKLVLGIAVLVEILGGCQQPTTRPGSSGNQAPVFFEDIAWISLMVDLPLLNDDEGKTPNGVLARVMLLRNNQSDYVAGKGSVIFHLMQRVRNSSGNYENQEMHTWRISEDEFAQSVVRQRFGLISHQVALYWGNLKPNGRGVYLQAQFIRTDKKEIWSRPVTIALPSNSETGR
jgi:hypothetical protein